MTIEPNSAHHFIEGYKSLLTTVNALAAEPSGLTGSQLLAHSRQLIANSPARLHSAEIGRAHV